MTGHNETAWLPAVEQGCAVSHNGERIVTAAAFYMSRSSTTPIRMIAAAISMNQIVSMDGPIE
jgi:hypothetical protein